MSESDREDFSLFAGRFVRNYWQTVKNGEFPMPPNEPIEETVEELMADISYATEPRDAFNESSSLYGLLMTSSIGDWWRFGFHSTPAGWKLAECSARSDDDTQPHDLLGAVYAQWFKPFLVHVTEVTNAKHSK